MQFDVITPLIDLGEVAEILELPQAAARAVLEARHDYPVASYHGKPLWLTATAHDILAGA